MGSADVRLIAAGGRYAYIASGTVVQALDLADPEHPELVAGDILAGVAVTVLAVADGRLLVVDQERVLYLFALTQPAAPVRMGQLQLPAAPGMVTAANGYVFAVCGAAGLWVIDARDPAAMAPAGHVPTQWITRGAAVDWPYVYLGERDPWEAVLRVVDVTDPVVPRVIAEQVLIGGADYLALDGDGRLVVAGPTGVMWTVDVSAPGRPVPRASMGLRAGRAGVLPGGRVYALAARGQTAFAGTSTTAVVVSTTADMDLAVTGQTEYVLSGAVGLGLTDDALLVLCGDGAVWVYRLPLGPNEGRTGQYGVGGSSADALADAVALDRGAILVGRDRRIGAGALQSQLAELAILRLGDKGALRRVASLNVTTDRLLGLAVARERDRLLVFGRPRVQQSCQRGKCSYAAAGYGFGTLDIGSLNTLAPEGYRSELHAIGAAASGYSAFVAVDTTYNDDGPVERFSRGVALFDLHNDQGAPQFFLFAPFQLDAGVAMPTFADVAVVDGWVYATAGAQGLQVFDARLAPRTIVWAARWRQDGVAVHGVAGRAGRLWLATSAGLVVLDVTDPRQPDVVSTLPTGGPAQAIALSGDYGVAVVGDTALALVDATRPEAPVTLHVAGLPPVLDRAGPTPAATVPPARAQVAVAADLVAAAVDHRLNLWRIVPGPPPTATPTVTATPEPTGTSMLPIPPSETPTAAASPTATATPSATSVRPGGTVYLPRLAR